MEQEGVGKSHLFTRLVNSPQDVSIRRLGEPRLLPALRVVLIASAEALRPVVKGITEGLVAAAQALPLGHEDLFPLALTNSLEHLEDRTGLTLSKAVEHALGWVAQKMGFLLGVVPMAMLDRCGNAAEEPRGILDWAMRCLEE